MGYEATRSPGPGLVSPKRTLVGGWPERASGEGLQGQGRNHPEGIVSLIVRRLCEFPGKGGTEESPAVNGMESRRQ